MELKIKSSFWEGELAIKDCDVVPDGGLSWQEKVDPSSESISIAISQLMFVEVALRLVESAARSLLSALHLTLSRSELENERAKSMALATRAKMVDNLESERV